VFDCNKGVHAVRHSRGAPCGIGTHVFLCERIRCINVGAQEEAERRKNSNGRGYGEYEEGASRDRERKRGEREGEEDKATAAASLNAWIEERLFHILETEEARFLQLVEALPTPGRK